MINVILFFLVAGILASIFFSVLMNRLRRRKATYKLYEVRDKFVLLVAKGELSEDSPVFKYFYKRINTLLQYAPNIGLDDALKSFILSSHANSPDFKNAIQRAKSNTDKIMKSKELESEAVAEAVKGYFLANREMVLSHSSLTRLLYYAIGHNLVNHWLLNKFPARIKKALAIVKISGEELRDLSERNGFAH
ncbi:hypothetical protein [Stutzerimonas marianensis]